MTAETEFVPRTDAEILAEYHRARVDYGYPVGTPLEALLNHEYCQGAQVRELIPDQEQRRERVLRFLLDRAVRRGA